MAVVVPEAPPQERTAPAPRRRVTPRRRRPALSERLTLNVVVGLVAALLAFVLASTLLSDRREIVSVAVAGERIPAGAVITPELVVSDEVPASTGFADALVAFERVESGALVTTRTLQPGEPLTESAVGSPGSVSGRRVMSIPLEASQAANGEIQVGDQVDVIEATREGSRYVLTGAAVVGRSAGEQGGGLVGGVGAGELVISVEVDGPQALEVARAIEAGTVMVVRSTGAPPIAVDAGTGPGG